MPPVETLDDNSDYSGFLSPGVSEELRKLALRKLFHSPLINVRDGLDDYDDDYRNFETLGKLLVDELRKGAQRQEHAAGAAPAAAVPPETGVSADGAGGATSGAADADASAGGMTAEAEGEPGRG